MKKISTFSALVLLTVLSISNISYSQIEIQKDKRDSIEQAFPVKPDAELTPGALCDKPSELRYPEKIKYCARDVSTDLKKQIIQKYDAVLGYEVGSMPRGDFKIDHYIPLCMGGANSADNLWPQHKTVYEQTDRQEQELCIELSHGDITQEQAIAEIKKLKNNIQVFVVEIY